MSNPTTLVTPFDGSAPGWTVSPPERYEDDGILLEQAGKNFHFNPLAAGTIDGETVAHGYLKLGAGATVSPDAGQSPPYGTNCVKVVTTGAGAQEGVRVYSDKVGALTGAAEPLAAGIYVKGDGLLNVQTTVVYTDASFVTVTTAIAPTGGWVRYFPPICTLNPAKTLSQSHTDVRRQGTQAGTFYVACPQIERAPAATEFMAGSRGAGYAWDATANASPSTRAASSASIPTAGIIESTSGSLAFRFTRKLDTGSLEPIIDCGDGTSGKDRLRVRINASDRLEMSWQTNGAAETTTQSVSTIAIDTEYLVYVGWNGIATELSIDNGTKVTGTRDTPAGSWGTAPLTLKAQ